MRTSRLLTTVDSHTGGESTRVVTGIPQLEGATLRARRDYFREHLDWIRTTLTGEPRGIGGVTVALVPPSDPHHSLGLVYLHSSGYPEMCGHATMGAVVVAAHLGLVELQEPSTQMLLDTPAGLVVARARVQAREVRSVTIRNVPAFVCASDVELDVPELGQLICQIAYGGNYYALLEAEQISHYGYDVDKLSVDELVALANRIIRVASRKSVMRHPSTGVASRLEGVLISTTPTHAQAKIRSIAISRTSVDRSPCGTGLSARMAVLYARGQLSLGETFIQEGLLGTCFTGILVEEQVLGDIHAVVPEITGHAYITGFYQAFLDLEDPFATGFMPVPPFADDTQGNRNVCPAESGE